MSDYLKDTGVANPEKEIFMALKQGTSKVPVLDVFARAYKFIDESATGRAHKNAPYFNTLKDYVLPLKNDQKKLMAAGYNEYKAFMLSLIHI